MPQSKKPRRKKSVSRKASRFNVQPVRYKRPETKRTGAAKVSKKDTSRIAKAVTSSADEFQAKAPARGMRYEIFGTLDPATVREMIVQKKIGVNTVFKAVHDAIGLDAKGISMIIDVTPRTIERRAAEAKPLERAAQADRTWRLARIYDFAVDMIGDPNKVARWLRAPNRFLKGRTPVEMLETEVGTQAVEQSLAAIGYGQVG